MVTSTNNRLYEEAASETSFVVSNSGSIEVFPVEGSKRRQRLALSQDLLRQKAYRVHFSVSNKSRYFRGCKRSIRWYVSTMHTYTCIFPRFSTAPLTKKQANPGSPSLWVVSFVIRLSAV